MYEKGGDIFLSSASQFSKKIICGRIKKVTKKTIVADFDINTKTIRIKNLGSIFEGIIYGSFCTYTFTLEDADRASIECSDKSADYFFKRMNDAKKNADMAIEVRNSAPVIRSFKE